ncbi:uncharacterized protein ACBR49_016238 [Aulostomus maculatus]
MRKRKFAGDEKVALRSNCASIPQVTFSITGTPGFRKTHTRRKQRTSFLSWAARVMKNLLACLVRPPPKSGGDYCRPLPRPEVECEVSSTHAPGSLDEGLSDSYHGLLDPSHSDSDESTVGDRDHINDFTKTTRSPRPHPPLCSPPLPYISPQSSPHSAAPPPPQKTVTLVVQVEEPAAVPAQQDSISNTLPDRLSSLDPGWTGRDFGCLSRSRSMTSLSLGTLVNGSNAQRAMEAPVPAEQDSVSNTLPAHSHIQTFPSAPDSTRRESGSLPRSHSMTSLTQGTSTKSKNLTRAKSLPGMLLKDFEYFSPDISTDEDGETYRLQCSSAGLYQCSVTGLRFHMSGGGDVDYRMVPWNRKLLGHHKKPAGPLFDIKCLQQSVHQLHLPHCETCCSGGWEFLSVAHVNNDNIEFINPEGTTKTHVIISISGCSGFGNVKDEETPPHPVKALVLLFYSPPVDPDPRSLLNMLLLPRNVVLRDLLRTRKKLFARESYMETPSHCKLQPQQKYKLTTSPENDSVRVQPAEAEFDEESYDNYFPSFQVKLKAVMNDINLSLGDSNTSRRVWDAEVSLSSSGTSRPCGSSALSPAPAERLLDIRPGFIRGISGPVLGCLLDKLLEGKVITDPERRSADDIVNSGDKARFAIDTVRRKGDAASSEMIEFLCDLDPFLSENIGLM